MYNWKPKLAEVDPENPQAWGTCARCNFVTNLHKMVWQYDFRGTPSPINTRILTCGRQTCLDVPNPQMSPLILSPDPEPIFNARPYPYALEESSYLITQDGSVITTEGGTYIGTAIPNPQDNAATAHLQTLIRAPGGNVTTAYLDLFNGNPLTTGVSVLAAITGSATRTNLASSLTTVSGIAKNTDTITIAAASGATINVNYAAIYSAATLGTPRMSGTLSVSGPSVTEGNPVVFNALGLQINLS